MSFDWKSLVGSVAPTIATALGGPFAGMAVKALSNEVLGEGEAGSQADLESKLSKAMEMDPEVMLRVKEAEIKFKTRLKELDIDLEKIHAQDRGSARKMAASTTLAPQLVLATIYVLAFGMILYVVFTGKVALSTDQQVMANYLLGILSAGLVQIMNFFYGSSAGSKEKTAKFKI